LRLVVLLLLLSKIDLEQTRSSDVVAVVVPEESVDGKAKISISLASSQYEARRVQGP
jgi:hypothetical protein